MTNTPASRVGTVRTGDRLHARPRRDGFTLVELLVVLGIIGLLMVILFPLVGRVREQARTASCMTNMRHFATAFVAYIGENRGDLPSSTTCGKLVASPAPAGRTGWVDGTNTLQAMRNGTFAKYITTPSAYKCPSDPLDERLRTVSMNYYINAYDKYGTYDPYIITRASQLQNPSRLIVFTDEPDPRGNWNVNGFIQPPLSLGSPDGNLIDPVVGWHSKGANFAFADGHAENWRWDDARTSRLLLDNPTWPSPGFNTPNNPDVKRVRAAVCTWK